MSYPIPMAMPLEPETAGMFPETLVEPFIGAPDLEVLADSVISAFDEFTSIAIAMREQGLSIAYVFETKPFDPLEEELKPHTIAKVTKASPLWRCLTGHELVVQFRQAFWDAFDDRQRTAVMHHELTHIDIGEPGKDGKLKLSLREHDVEDFALTMRRFGPILPSRATFVKAFLDWQHEQEHPEPTKLRAIGDEVMDRVVEQVNAGALGPNVTASRITRTRVITGGLDDPMDDLRPTGEVNVDELHGAAERSVEPDDLSDLPF